MLAVEPDSKDCGTGQKKDRKPDSKDCGTELKKDRKPDGKDCGTRLEKDFSGCFCSQYSL